MNGDLDLSHSDVQVPLTPFARGLGDVPLCLHGHGNGLAIPKHGNVTGPGSCLTALHRSCA